VTFPVFKAGDSALRESNGGFRLPRASATNLRFLYAFQRNRLASMPSTCQIIYSGRVNPASVRLFSQIALPSPSLRLQRFPQALESPAIRGTMNDPKRIIHRCAGVQNVWRSRWQNDAGLPAPVGIHWAAIVGLCNHASKVFVSRNNAADKAPGERQYLSFGYQAASATWTLALAKQFLLPTQFLASVHSSAVIPRAQAVRKIPSHFRDKRYLFGYYRQEIRGSRPESLAVSGGATGAAVA
jgi:hypothetical protein